jgi:hypothetical protein
MNASIHRVGLAVAAIALVVTVGGVFVADGYFSASRTASAATPGSSNSVSPSVTATGTLPPEVVYVRPAPSPEVIHVTKTAPPPPPQVVHITVPGTGGEGNDGEGGTAGNGESD